MKEIKIQAIYKIVCPRSIIFERNCQIINMKIDLEECKKCRYHKNYDLKKLKIYCQWREK